jgi:hypothetical protein
MKKQLFIIGLFIFGCGTNAWSGFLQPFGVVTVAPDFEVNGKGKNIDSIAFWEANTPSDTLMFVTAKRNSLVEVWKFPFVDNEQMPLIHSTFFKNKVNGICVDQDGDLLFVSIAGNSSTTAVFTLPQLDFRRTICKAGCDLKSEPNLALLVLRNGRKRIYISADNRVFMHDAVTGRYFGEFTPETDVEAMVGDHFYQLLYIPDENDRTGVYAYTPDGRLFTKNGRNRFGSGFVFQNDGEGIVVYVIVRQGNDTGEGFIVVSDQRQRQTDFEFFDRQSWAHLGTLRLKGVSNTDGVASTQQALPGYPLGIFAAVNDDTSVAGVGWDKIFESIGLSSLD